MKKTVLCLSVVITMAACNKDNIEPVVVPPSSGNTLQLSGIIGNEPGSAAGNSVFVDFSADKQTAVARASWDLGFYCGSDFRVIINNTTVATAKGTTKNSLADVNGADTIGVVTAFQHYDPVSFSLMDDVDGAITQTVIPAIGATEAENKVVIVNRGTGGSTPARDYIKIKILRNGSNGYTLQYAKLTETTYKSLNIEKDSKYNFKYVSFDNGPVNVEPEKSNWDMRWSLVVFKTPYTAGFVPYIFSDFITLNNKAGAQAFRRDYATAEIAAAAFTAFNKDSVSKYTYSNDASVVGSTWRTTAMPGAATPAGTVKTRFYIVKDNSGNAYKVKFLSFTTEDGGTRGKPEIKYELIK